jgi:peptidoglycan-associated lipoprotein
LYRNGASPIPGLHLQAVVSYRVPQPPADGPSIAFLPHKSRGDEPQLYAAAREWTASENKTDNRVNAMKRNVWMVALVTVAATAACGKQQAPVQPEPQTPPPVQAPPQARPAPTPTDNGAAEREAERRRIISILEQTVHFDYDEATIRADAQERLAAKVPLLRSNPGIRIRLEGHADERGSVEYNLALGMRRANAVRQYLMEFGIDGSRFETFSYGEDRPSVQGATESAWSQNRRAEFRITTGI